MEWGEKLIFDNKLCKQCVLPKVKRGVDQLHATLRAALPMRAKVRPAYCVHVIR